MRPPRCKNIPNIGGGAAGMHQIAGGLEESPGISRRKRRNGSSTETNLTTQGGVTIHQRASVLAVAIDAIRPGGKQHELCRVG
jgi:hypothetical protein